MDPMALLTWITTIDKISTYNLIAPLPNFMWISNSQCNTVNALHLYQLVWQGYQLMPSFPHDIFSLQGFIQFLFFYWICFLSPFSDSAFYKVINLFLLIPFTPYLCVTCPPAIGNNLFVCPDLISNNTINFNLLCSKKNTLFSTFHCNY